MEVVEAIRMRDIGNFGAEAMLVQVHDLRHGLDDVARPNNTKQYFLDSQSYTGFSEKPLAVAVVALSPTALQDLPAFTSAYAGLFGKGQTPAYAYLGHMHDTTARGADHSHVLILHNPISSLICHP